MNKKTTTHNKNDKKKLSEDMKMLAIYRLRSTPANFQISIGGGGSLMREEAIENIEKESELAKELVDIQIEFIKDMARGELYQYE